MNKEQNIDDILNQLKSSYQGDSVQSTPQDTDIKSNKSNALSHDELQEMLKKAYMPSGEVKSTGTDEESSFAYAIDGEFLEEARLETEEAYENITELEEIVEIEEKLEADEITELEEIAEIEDKLEMEEAAELTELEEIVSLDTFEENKETENSEVIENFCEESDDTDDAVFIENESGDIVLVDAVTGEIFEEEQISSEKIEFEAEIDELESEIEVIEDKALTEDTSYDEKSDEEAFFSSDDGQLALFDFSDEQEELPDEDEEIDYGFSDDSQMVMDFGETDASENTEGDDLLINGIDDACLGIMLEVGDIKTAQSHIAADRVNTYISNTKRANTEKIDASETFAFDGNEYESESQSDDLRESYKKEKISTLLRLLGCGFFTALLFLYELFPVLGFRTEILPSYDEYPTAYLLIGMQLLICSAAFAWRELLRGLRKVFSLKADRWSALAFVVIMVPIYNIAMMITNPDEITFMFGTVVSIYIWLALVAEYLDVLREIKSFEIYSAAGKKFTFNTEGGINSAADKMYRGGLPYDKNVFEPYEIDFPNGYFSAANMSVNGGISMVYMMITPAVLLSTVAFIVSVIMQNSIDISMSLFMVTLTSLCPISMFAARSLPMYRATSRLYRRDIAIAGEGMAEKYAKCDYIIFSDLHLFKKASASDCGIVIFDESKTRTVIEYLGALYSEIGGPMKEMFSVATSVPHTVKMRRIARSGIEAVSDRIHSLVLGDSTFVQRYGIVFPQNEKADDNGVLYFAIDGKPAAKLCLRYKCEPLFEMLLIKMAENGVQCAIETFDPVINSAFAAKSLKNKSLPINVIHKNAADFYAEQGTPSLEDTGLVVSASRFKLIEGVVWCKRLRKISRILNIFAWVTFGIAVCAIGAVMALGFAERLTQYSVLILQLMALVPTFAAMGILMPPKNYFLK